MKAMAIIFLYFFSYMLKLLKPGGAKSIMAENLAMRQQLIVIKRKSKMTKAPALTPLQRIIFGVLTYFISKTVSIRYL